MSYRRSRKRRRSQAFPAEEEEGEQGEAITRDVKESSQENDEATGEELEKELEIWDAFREDHFEGLPFNSIPRRVLNCLIVSYRAAAFVVASAIYFITRTRRTSAGYVVDFILSGFFQLRPSGYNRDLLPTILRYIKLRQSLTARPEQGQIFGIEQPTKSEPPPTPIQNLSTPLNGSRSSSSCPVSATKGQSTPVPAPPVKMPLITSFATTRTPTPLSIPLNRVKPPQTTREMLSHIAWLSEEILRASEEKVNLAQAAYDSVRPIFLLFSPMSYT
jgi:hypothetical protein